MDEYSRLLNSGFSFWLLDLVFLSSKGLILSLRYAQHALWRACGARWEPPQMKYTSYTLH